MPSHRTLALGLLTVAACGCPPPVAAPAVTPPPPTTPTARELADAMTAEQWAACDARLTRVARPDGLVEIHPNGLTAALADDDACAAASGRFDDGLYAVIRTQSQHLSPWKAIGRGGPRVRLEGWKSVDGPDGVRLIKLQPHVTSLGCHLATDPDHGHVTHANAPRSAPLASMVWVPLDTTRVRFVRDEYAGYDPCEVLRRPADLDAIAVSPEQRTRIAAAIAKVDFTRDQVMVNLGALAADRGLAVEKCADDSARNYYEDPPVCRAIGGDTVVQVWRDINGPCQGTPPDPDAPSYDSHWSPPLLNPLVVLPLAAGRPWLEQQDTELDPPCA